MKVQRQLRLFQERTVGSGQRVALQPVAGDPGELHNSSNESIMTKQDNLALTSPINSILPKMLVITSIVLVVYTMIASVAFLLTI
jgi:hypothetical protein